MTPHPGASPTDVYKSKFDFTSTPCPSTAQTATIKDLLMELNDQKVDESTADYDLKSLRTELRLLSSITGVESPRSVHQPLSVNTLKTLKLLFKRSQFIDAHLIRIIDLPGAKSPATVDFFTSPATSEGEDVKRQIRRMIDLLTTEIDEDEIALIEEVCDPSRFRETFRQNTNEAIDKIILTCSHVDDDLIEAADVYLADQTRRFLDSITPLKRESRPHVALYTYLQLLDYLHRLHFEITTRLTITNDIGVTNKRVDFTQLCQKLSEVQQRSISIETNFMSINEVPTFGDAYKSDIAALVSMATGFTYNKRDVTQDSARALIALQLYLHSAGLPDPLNQKPIGVVHVVAAYCSVLHQRKLKSKPDKNSKKYGTKFASPQKLLDSFICRRSTHFPFTAQFIYTTRTQWYTHALLGRKQKADSHLAVQIAQSELTRDVLLTSDHIQIRRHLSSYREFMINAANDFVILHGRQGTIYAWRHGC